MTAVQSEVVLFIRKIRRTMSRRETHDHNSGKEVGAVRGEKQHRVHRQDVRRGAQPAHADVTARGPILLALEQPSTPGGMVGKQRSQCRKWNRILKINLKEGREGPAGSRRDEQKEMRSKTSSMQHQTQRD